MATSHAATSGAGTGTSGASNSTPSYCTGTELSSSRVGGRVLFATNEWFASANNMLNPDPPLWREGVFTEYGKWMDGWESMRKRTPGHDWCILQLGIPGQITGIEVDTRYFTGNYAPAISVQAAADPEVPRDLQQWQSEAGLIADAADFELARELNSDTWETILPQQRLQPGHEGTSRHFFEVFGGGGGKGRRPLLRRVTHLRINIHPDGGIARLRVFGNVSSDLAALASSARPVDLVAVENGGVAIGWSDKHYGHPSNLVCPGRGVNMGDGWETARKADRPAVIVLAPGDGGHCVLPGEDSVVFQLGVPGRPSRIEVDTLHFKGNFPESFRVEACRSTYDGRRHTNLSMSECQELGQWFELLPRTKGQPHSRHFYAVECPVPFVTHVRLTIFPDGGISRFRLWGLPDREATLALMDTPHARL